MIREAYVQLALDQGEQFNVQMGVVVTQTSTSPRPRRAPSAGSATTRATPRSRPLLAACPRSTGWSSSDAAVVAGLADTSSGALTSGFRYQAMVFDPNADNVIDPADIFFLINYLFTGGQAPHGEAGLLSGDANNDVVVDPAQQVRPRHALWGLGPRVPREHQLQLGMGLTRHRPRAQQRRGVLAGVQRAHKQ